MMDAVTSNWFEEMTDTPKLAWREYLTQHYSLYGQKHIVFGIVYS